MKTKQSAFVVVLVLFILVGSIGFGMTQREFANTSQQAVKPSASYYGSSSPNAIPNGDFEDARVYGVGAYAFPYGWTAENHSGSVYSMNTNSDAFWGSRCWEMSSGPGYGWKNIWYYLNGTGAPDVCAFGVKLVQENNNNDVIQVKICDLNLTQSAGSDVELIYEFSLGSQQVWQNSTYQEIIHERIVQGIWYLESRWWMIDWQRAYGSPANLSDCWALLLGVSTANGSDQMIARFDAITMYSYTWGPVFVTKDISSDMLFASVAILLWLSFAFWRKKLKRETQFRKG